MIVMKQSVTQKRTCTKVAENLLTLKCIVQDLTQDQAQLTIEILGVEKHEEVLYLEAQKLDEVRSLDAQKRDLILHMAV